MRDNAEGAALTRRLRSKYRYMCIPSLLSNPEATSAVFRYRYIMGLSERVGIVVLAVALVA